MKQYECDKIRNVGVVGQAGSGKTSLVEALLYDAGATSRIGKVEDGNTVTDFDAQEVKRGISIHAALAPIEWEGYKFNIVDTPGYADFVGEVISILKAVDSLIFLFDGVTGIGVGADLIWKYADEYKLPRIAFINRLDKERADFYGVVERLRNKFGKQLFPLWLPVGAEANFKGVVDLVKLKAYSFPPTEALAKAGEKGKVGEEEVPAEVKESIPKYKEMLIEALAEVDDTLLSDYLENKEITEEEMVVALKKGLLEGKVVPIICGSVTKNIGLSRVFEVLRDFMPSPRQVGEAEGIDPKTGGSLKRKPKSSEPFSAYVFKTVTEPHVGELSFLKVLSGTLSSSTSVYNSTKKVSERVGQLIFLRGKTKVETPKAGPGDIVVLPKLKHTGTGDTLCASGEPVLYPAVTFPEPVISLAVKPKSKADQEKIGLGFGAFSHEDPTFKMRYDPETKETVISGMGDIHLEVMLERLRERYGVAVETGTPRIPYKEAIRGKAKAQGKYKKQTGGRGQYGDTWLEVEPLPRGKGFEFVNKVVGGAIPRSYIPSVEKGVKEAMVGGVITGYPVVDVKVTLYDGTYHEVDSSDMAFKIAASMGFKKAFQGAKPTALEPIMHIEVSVPSEYVGEVTGDLNKRRGRILGIEGEKVTAQVPLAEIATYATDLRSLSHGRGMFTTKFLHYQEVPGKTQEELVTKYQKAKEAGK